MKIWTLLTTLPLTLVLTSFGCDSGPDTEELDESIERTANEDAPEDGTHRKGKRGHQHKRMSAEKICGLVTCDDEQRAQVATLFENTRAERKVAWKAHKADMSDAGGPLKTANSEMAEKFRSDSLSAADLETFHESMKASFKDHTDRPSSSNSNDALLLGLHALLTPEQRATLADNGLPRLLEGGKHHRHGKRSERGEKGERGEGHAEKREHSKRGEKGERRSKHMGGFEKLCATVECSDAQRTELTTMMEAKHAEHKAMRAQRRVEREAVKEADADVHAQTKVEKKAAKDALTNAFRDESFSQTELDTFRQAMKQLKHERHDDEGKRSHGSHAEMILAIHGLLTPEQRERAATVIETEGLHAFMGKRGGHGKRGKRGGHGKRGKHGKHGKRGEHGKHGKHGEQAPN